MKIICSKTSLLKGVNTVLKAVPSKTTMPILECILIDATLGKIKFTANDMELGIETTVDGSIQEKGIVALDAKIFSEIVRKLPENEVTIETDAKLNTTITCEKAKFNIPGQSGDDFTGLPAVEKNESITLTQFTLKEVIRQTIFSIAANENNKMMTGELFEVNGSLLKVVSLDGHRISIRKVELKENFGNIKVVVPGKTLTEVSKILSGETDDDVRIFFTTNHIVFEFEETIVVSRLIEGEYFRIDQMLSSDYETKITVNKRELLSCIDRATLLPLGTEFPDIHTADIEAEIIPVGSRLGRTELQIPVPVGRKPCFKLFRLHIFLIMDHQSLPSSGKALMDSAYDLV